MNIKYLEYFDVVFNQLSELTKKPEGRITKEKRDILAKRYDTLLKLGMIVEYVLNDYADAVDVRKLYTFLKEQEIRGNYFSKAMDRKLKN